MIREIAIFLYLFLFRMVFFCFRVFPLREKTIFITHFGTDIVPIVEEIEKQKNDKVIISLNRYCRMAFQEKENRKVIDLKEITLKNWLEFVYHLATSKRVVCDNYYGFLAVTEFKKEVTCVQIWHAAGAIKKFGLEDLSVKGRSRRAVKRFKKVYNRFDKVAVGSDKMAGIFSKSFGLPAERMVKTGVPRTDFFFDDGKKKFIQEKMLERYPLLKSKKVILYAPTYRDDGMKGNASPFCIDSFYQALKEEYVLIYKLHPADAKSMNVKYPDFELDMSGYKNINDLLLITDVLISDYSSVPFEYSLLEKPMIFFAYDLEEYEEKRGIWEPYSTMVPGPVGRNTDEIITLIKKNQFDADRIKQFKNQWNTYSKGCSSRSLVKELYKQKNA